MKRFKIGSKVYESATLDRIAMGDLLRLRSETYGLLGPEEGGIPQGLTWSYVTGLNETISALDEGEVVNHDLFPVFIAVLVWASKRNAGEDLSFFDAQDYTFADLEFLPDPGDHKQAAGPQKARPNSGRAAKHQAAGKPEKQKTSETASSDA